MIDPKREVRFSNKEELLEWLRRDDVDACQEGYDWACACVNLDQILRDVKIDWRLWCVYEGALQFLDNMTYKELTPWQWTRLLIDFPEKADKCNLDLLTSTQWASLVCDCDEFEDRCPWDMLCGVALSWVLSSKPRLLPKVEKHLHKLCCSNWVSLLIDRPEFIEHCNIDIIRGNGWVQILLNADKSLEAYCRWETLSGDDWARLLRFDKSYYVRCEWNKLEVKDWLYLLDFHPELIEHCPAHIREELAA